MGTPGGKSHDRCAKPRMEAQRRRCCHNRQLLLHGPASRYPAVGVRSSPARKTTVFRLRFRYRTESYLLPYEYGLTGAENCLSPLTDAGPTDAPSLGRYAVSTAVLRSRVILNLKLQSTPAVSVTGGCAKGPPNRMLSLGLWRPCPLNPRVGRILLSSRRTSRWGQGSSLGLHCGPGWGPPSAAKRIALSCASALAPVPQPVSSIPEVIP